MLQELQGFQLSPQQKRLWSLQQHNSVYYADCAILLTGNLQINVLKEALKKVIERNEILRTSFYRPKGITTPVQIIEDSSNLLLTEQTITTHDNLNQVISRLLVQEKDQDREYIFSPKLIHINSNTHILLVSLPALCADTISLNNLVAEISRCYISWGQDEEILDEPLQYADIAAWLNELLEEEEIEEARKYWQQIDISNCQNYQLIGENSQANLEKFCPHVLTVPINQQLAGQIEEIAQKYQISTSGFFLTSWLILLWRLTGNYDLIIGTMFDGRNYDELKAGLGLFAKYLPLLCHLEDSESFRDVLAKVAQITAEMADWQEGFTWEINSANQQDGDIEFFPFCFEFTEAPQKYTAGEISLTIHQHYVCFDRFKIKLACVRTVDNELNVELHYDSNLFAITDIQSIGGRFSSLLASAVENPQLNIAQINILSDTEKQKLLVDFNHTQSPESPYQCVHHWFEKQCEQTPDNIAVVFAEQKLTYRELNTRANQLAHYLQKLGVGAEVLVGICVERSPLMVISVLAVLKAGGVYVPIDPTYPTERKAFILADTQMPLLLTQTNLVADLGTENIKTICLDTDEDAIYNQPLENPVSTTSTLNLAYVIYTSGSTGKPKGTLISHYGLVNYLQWCTQTYKVAQGAGTLVHSSLGFDLTITSLFSPLLVGSQVELLPESEGIESLAQTLKNRTNLSLVKITPAHLKVLSQQLSPQEVAGRTNAFIIGGENLTTQHINFWQKYAPETVLINEYGPTETVVGCCIYQVPNEHDYSGSIPIGRPIANTQLYVLDQYLQPVPIGVAGELYIGGAGVARGYLNLPELTAQKFIPHPFSHEPGTRLYKTGDIARYLTNGEIEYLGRTDDQVKLRGYRIELGEIEAVLEQHQMVRQCVVMVREDLPGNQRLVAYLVKQKDVSPTEFTTNKLRQYLQQQLPDYMVPSAFVILDDLPLTSNGKVNRRALPAPDTSRDCETDFVAPRTPTEKVLATIWAEVLGLEQVGIYDNFFELGGDSILSIQIVARTHQAGLQTTPKQLFSHQTIAELATAIGTVPLIQAEQGVVTGTVPLTPIQQWFFEQNLPQPHHFNQSVLLEVAPDLKPELWEQVLQHLLMHHDALRLRFRQDGDRWLQVNAAFEKTQALQVIDLSAMTSEQQQAAIEATGGELQVSLNLSAGPLVCGALFNLGSNQPSRLLLIIHHLAVDGVSWRILLEDLVNLYEQLNQGKTIQLPAKTTSFQQWSRRIQEYAQSTTLRSELSYWLTTLNQKIEPLPVDYPGGDNSQATVRNVTVVLTVEETQALLREVSAAYGVQINEVLLTALIQALIQWTGTSSLLIDLEGHGREEIFDDVDLSRTVGWFTSIFPVMFNLGNAVDPTDALRKVKQQLAIPNRGFGYGVLRYLSSDRTITKQLQALPQAQVCFNYLGQFDQFLPKSSWLKPAKESAGASRSLQGNRRYLLEIQGMVIGRQLHLQCAYSQNLHSQETVENLVQQMMATVRSLIICSHSNQVSSYTPDDFPDVDLSADELNQILTELNLD